MIQRFGAGKITFISGPQGIRSIFQRPRIEISP